jgi:hypothetical protein
MSNEQPGCSICHENLTKNKIAYGPNCGHEFHPKCLNDWIKHNSNARCPLCRKSIILSEHNNIRRVERENKNNTIKNLKTKNQQLKTSTDNKKRKIDELEGELSNKRIKIIELSQEKVNMRIESYEKDNEWIDDLNKNTQLFDSLYKEKDDVIDSQGKFIAFSIVSYVLYNAGHGIYIAGLYGLNYL